VKLPCVGWILGAALLCAQPASDSARIYEIRGQVLDADTGIGVPRATVSLTLSPVGAQPVQRAEPVVLLTDTAGAFRVTNIPTGIANLSCERTGYFRADSPPLSAATVGLVDPKVTAATVTLYLRRAAVIRGTALDERGASLGGNVQAFRLVLVDGRRVPQFATAANVDMEGAFRITGLKPGRYYVALSPFPSSDARRLNRVYRPAFYPGSPDFAGARIVAVASGDDPQIDFRPASEPTYEIRVKVPGPGEGGSVSVYPAQVGGLPNPPTVGFVSWDERQRAYRVTGLPSGQYTITGQWMAGSMWAFGSRRIAINGGNAGEVVLEASTEDTLPVAVSYDPPGHQPMGYIQLISASGTFSVSQDSAGTQAFRQLKPGSYEVMAVGNAYVRSARQGGRDALRDGVLVPEQGSPERLEVSLGERSAGFETTSDVGETQGRETITVAFLRQTSLGLHFEQQTSIQARTVPTGIQAEKDPPRFIRVSGLRPISDPPPGAYVVIAWTGSGASSQLPYNEPGFLDRYASLIEHATLGETVRQTVVIHHLLPNSAFEQY
jgi:hypothetical protein